MPTVQPPPPHPPSNIRHSPFHIPHSTFAILLILLLAFGLRVAGLEQQSLWYDEGVSAYLTTLPIGELTRWTAADIQPPLYYYMLAGWTRLFGHSEAALRWPSVLFSLLTVALAWRAGRRLHSEGAGLLAALFCAASPLYIWYAQEARNYALLTFLGLLASLLLFDLCDRSHSFIRGPHSRMAGRAQDAPTHRDAPSHSFIRVRHSRMAGRAQDAPTARDASDHSFIRGPHSWMAAPARSWIAGWIAYAAVCMAALYTHYFAAFLLAFHVVFFVAVAWRERWPRPAWLAGFAAWLAVALAYLPWLPFQLGRFGSDESYWAGALKLGEALRKLLISFSLGETVLEPIGWPLALGCTAILFVGVLALWAWGRRQSLLFLTLYLLTPIAGILLLALQTPKFNPRYLMPASPAFFLLLACGLAALAGKRLRRARAAATQEPTAETQSTQSARCIAQTSSLRSLRLRGGFPRRQVVAAGLCLVLLAGFAYSDRNLYLDPAFSKADFRGVAAYLRAHRQPDEAIILVSGHIFPVFDYYLPGAERILLPAERTLSTERVVGFEAGRELAPRLADTAGAWVVRWQDDVVDPNAVLELLLDSAGQRQALDASFWQVRLDHYRWPAGAEIPTQPPITQPTAVNFGGQIELAGWSQPRPDEYVLFWRALQPISADLSVSLRLLDAQDLLSGQADRRPAAYLYPTTRWKPGEVVPGRGRLPALPGIPPGAYYLQVRVYAPDRMEGFDVLDSAGAAQGKAVTVGPFRLAEAGRATTGAALGVPLDLDYRWGGLALRGMGRLPDSVASGETLLVELAWSCIQPTARPWSATLTLQPAGRRDVAVEQDLLLLSLYPTDQWRAGEWLRAHALIRVPADWPAGPSDVILSVSDGPAVPPSVTLGQVQVRVPPHDFAPPSVQAPVGARAGVAIGLLGYSLEPAQPAAGAPFTLTLIWQPDAQIDTSYTAFVHLLDAAGALAAQLDRQPAEGARPTTGWVPGEFIADRYEFVAFPEGGSVEIGLYETGRAGMRRLAWSDSAGAPLGDALRLPLE